MMQRFLFSHVLEQTLHQHHTSRPVLAPLLSLSRFVSSTLKITTASDSTSSLPVTIDSFNPKKLQQDLKSNKDAYTFNEINNLEGLRYNQAKGATMMYLFPQINLHRKLTEAAETTKPSTDAFYCKRTLNTSGSHFGQVPITWHFRSTILSQENKIPSIANRVREFHKSSTTNDIPKRTKFQKQHRGRINKGISSFPRGNRLGKYGLQTLEPAWITSRQIEAGRKAMIRNVTRGEKVLVHIFADKPITKRPTETRMGRGKGATAFWVAVVKPGKIIYEMGGVPEKYS